jgi:hypothetical protein
LQVSEESITETLEMIVRVRRPRKIVLETQVGRERGRREGLTEMFFAPSPQKIEEH